ncbi:hypothetical protein BGZ50_006950 [Haplosporangium sp. Z 11]|nr:hypothetical protein BGZ50_006950 [Haplosporangium sp. Z 11]
MKICVVTLDPMEKAIDRFVFETSVMRPFEERLQGQGDRDQLPAAATIMNKGKDRAVEDMQPRSDRSDREETDSPDDHAEDEEDGEEPLHRISALEKANRQLQQHQQRELQDRQLTREGPKFGRTIALTTDLEMMLRAMLLKISVCNTDLAPLGQGKLPLVPSQSINPSGANKDLRLAPSTITWSKNHTRQDY